MRIIVIGDPHFKNNNKEDTDIMVTKIIENINKHQPEFVVCLGDTLHDHNKLTIKALDRAIYFLKLIQDICPLYLLIGNHDRPNNSVFLTNEHPFNSLKYWNNTKVIDYPLLDIISDHQFIFVPYVPTGRFQETLDKLPYQKSKITAIFAHQEFKGCNMNNITSNHGDEWSEQDNLVISGHIHDYHRPQKNIIYTGTPIQHSFGETSKKTISIFDFDSDNDYVETRVDLGLIKKQTLNIQANESLIEEINQADKNLKIVMNCTNDEFKKMMKLAKTKELIKQGVKIVHKNNQQLGQIKLNKNVNYIDNLYQNCETQELKDLLKQILEIK